MTQVDQCESDVMRTQKVSILAVEADEQGTELVDPGETALIGEAVLVDCGVEQALAPSLWLFAVACVFGDIGDELMIETHAACLTGVKGSVGVEVSPGNPQTKPFHRFEGGL